nr:hypothetical protein [Tanacetum cinerariifolium]
TEVANNGGGMGTAIVSGGHDGGCGYGGDGGVLIGWRSGMVRRGWWPEISQKLAGVAMVAAKKVRAFALVEQKEDS